jgi:WD40 repeat protein
MKNLKLKDEDVAKLTEHRGTSLFVHPSETSIIVAAGDKSGNFGLWDLNSPNSGVDGVFKYKPHVSNICRIWSDSSNIFTASYDGTVRYLDAQKNAFILAHTCQDATMDDMYYTDAAPSNSSPSLVFFTRSDGIVCAADLRAGGDKYVFKYSTTFEDAGDSKGSKKVLVEGGKMNSVQEHPSSDKTVVTAGNRGAVCLFDVRGGSKGGTLKAVTALLGHSKSINAAHVSPDGEVVVSVSQDNTIRAWTGALQGNSAVKCHSVSHDNHTGRWLSTFRPTWDPKHPAALISGSMAQPRCIEVFTATGRGKQGEPVLSLVHKFKGDFLGSVCSRNAVHPTLDIVVGFNSSGRVHVLR